MTASSLQLTVSFFVFRIILSSCPGRGIDRHQDPTKAKIYRGAAQSQICSAIDLSDPPSSRYQIKLFLLSSAPPTFGTRLRSSRSPLTAQETSLTHLAPSHTISLRQYENHSPHPPTTAKMVNVFAVPVFFIVFRETTETSIIVSVLLAFIKQQLGPAQDKALYKKLRNQVSPPASKLHAHH